MATKYEVGDKVLVNSMYGTAKGTRTVVKVNKTNLVLDNGDRYDHDGAKKSAGRRMMGGSITKLCPICEQIWSVTHRCQEAN